MALGAIPLWLDPVLHDKWVAETSHLPYLLSNALAYSTSIESAELIGPGFKSSTRLAIKPRSMMVDIMQTNQHNILRAIEQFQARLAQLKEHLEAEDYARLTEELSLGAAQYEAIIGHDREGE
jgi:prephenate dehydrogenase